MSDLLSRQDLLTSTRRDEQDFERALADLKRAVSRPFAIGEQVGEHVHQHPLPWLIGCVLIGVWFGSRRA